MNWLIWKQHHRQFLGLALILGMFAAVAIPTGWHFWDAYQHARASCPTDVACSQLGSQLLQTSWEMNLNPSLPSGAVNLVVLIILALPFLLGTFIGVPLVAREYNAGTNLLIWTRSISRRKWLTAKLLWTLGATILFVGAFAALTTWWSQTGNALNHNRFDTLKFGLQGMAPVGYAVFAVSLGICLGAWLKRVMAAVGLMLAILLVTQVAVAGFIRPHYMTPLTKAVWADQLAPGLDATQIAKDVLVTNSAIVNKQGQPIDWANPPAQCIVSPNELPLQSSTESHMRAGVSGGDGTIRSVNGGPAVKGSCLRSAGYHYQIRYQPADRYWNFQLIETGLYLTLSLLLVGATYGLVLKRDA